MRKAPGAARASCRSFVLVIPAYLILIVCLVLAGCAARRPIVTHELRNDGALTALSAAQKLVPGDPVIQVYHAGKAVIFSDYFTGGPLGMFGLPPKDALDRAATLEPEQAAAVGAWTLIGIHADPNLHISLKYMGANFVVHSNRIATPHIITTAGKFGIPNAQVDMLLLSAGQAAYVDMRGRLVQMTTEGIAEIRKAREVCPAYHVLPGDNPLVTFCTSKGDVTVELLENESPRCVAAFLSQVEEGYWNKGCVFYRVCPWSTGNEGEKLRIAQVGDAKGQRPASARVEPDRNRLSHKRGTLAMLADDTGADPCHVFFNLADGVIQNWHGVYPVFGRVWDGEPEPRLPSRDTGESVPSAGVTVLESLRPGDTVRDVKVIRQRRVSYRASTSKQD